MTAMPSADSERVVFIARVWNQSADEATWLGVIQHVGTGAVAHVRDARELLDYLTGQFEAGEIPRLRESGLR
jgi:hypothetical protein